MLRSFMPTALMIVVPLASHGIASAADATQSVSFDVTTSNCKDTVVEMKQVCAPKGWHLIEGALSYRSQNGASRIEAIRVDSRCFKVTATATPLGEDCILNICNCRGRGWVKGDIVFTGTPE
ncbi:hypothetical protein EFD56_27840 [Rhizobium phaseoli]|uniref:hypothetical protein n=1 Tax=Rhizobium phaseoli TaxID=396 RepID=UPI000F8600F2|nr:hypothetical protein [Rhizobium phaseoli]RUM13471.1 hypothetical protein EFD56_27840 [Rhizobium phaseoli]